MFNASGKKKNGQGGFLQSVCMRPIYIHRNRSATSLSTTTSSQLRLVPAIWMRFVRENLVRVRDRHNIMHMLGLRQLGN